MKEIKLPDEFIIRGKIESDLFKINPHSDKWFWRTSGRNYKIIWSEFSFSKNFKKFLKLFLIRRFETLSVESVSNGEISFIKEIVRQEIDIPFTMIKMIGFLENVKEQKHISSFKKFYKYGLKISYFKYDRDTYNAIFDFKGVKKNPYEGIFLNQDYFNQQDIRKVKTLIRSMENSLGSFDRLRDNILLQIFIELAPRPSQLYLTNREDFKIYKGVRKSYYSILMPMTKKIKSNSIEKRNRNISESLGRKISLLLESREYVFSKSNALFISEKGMRLGPSPLSSIIKKYLSEINLNKNSIDFRHNLAQALADQGASADIIAEILGHNSTVPARAYIAATPKIAEIKSKALSKNKKYNNLIKMMTGDFIEESTVLERNKVRGVIGSQYIGGIGSCGLPEDTLCPKNPVYSCYTCIKFHPFKNKEQHLEVKNQLEKRAQFFIDIAEKGNDLEHNRPVTQLSETIDAVEKIITIINNE